MPLDAAKTTVSGRARDIASSREILNKSLATQAAEKGLNVSRYLETLDPSKDHGDGTKSDAFNRVLRACGINTRSVPAAGIAASTLEDVVKHPRARHLALEIFARAYRKVAYGEKRAPVLSTIGQIGSFINQYQYPAPRDILLDPAIPLTEVVGQTTGIRANVYRPFYLEDVKKANSRVSEAAEIPAVRIAHSEKTITLKKYGRRIDVTYETLRHIPIDLLSFYVQRIAIAVEAEKVDKVLDIIVNGDGSVGSSATNYNLTTLDSGTTANNLTLKAWLAFKMKFKNPLRATTILAQDAAALSLMLLNTGSANIPLVMMGWPGGTQSLTPINQTLAGGERIGWIDSAPAGKLVAFDKRLAIERVFEIGSNIQETDQDVKSQINSLVLSEIEGYAVIDPKASKTLNLAA